MRHKARHLSRACVLSLLVVANVAAADRDTRLIDAVKRQTGQARALIAQHVSVNATLPDGTTALHWAAYRDDHDTAAALVRAGAAVNAATRTGVTPLWLACRT